MTESASSTSGQEFDVFSVMDWKDGVGTLPGSDLKFRVNEFGALEVITDESEMDSVKKATATTTWMVPTAQEVFSEKTGVPFRLKDQSKVDGLQFCENCCQYGNGDECLSGGNYCSQNCARHVKDNRDQKEERDGGEDNEDEDPKCSRKKKPKLSLKADSKEDGEERDDEMENKQDGRILRGSQRARRKRRGDSTVLKQGLPPKGKKTWCWASYLEEEKAVAVPAKLFKEHQSFPYNKNGFKVGMKLEGVDPEHQSVYCVLTVAEVCGYRIKLHFDGYSDCYDFWVNADALDIHPVGWCEKTGHKLQPPKGYKEEEFNWQSYLKTCKAQAAPKSLFENQNITAIPSGFRVGMKLEAVDKKNPSFICVATVTDMVDNRFLVHFDNWDESYDYWDVLVKSDVCVLAGDPICNGVNHPVHTFIQLVGVKNIEEPSLPHQVHMKDVMSALWVSGLDSSYLREQMLNEPLVREIVKECSNIPLSQPQQGEAMLASFKPRGYSECIVTIGGEERVSRKPTAAMRCMCPLYDPNRQLWIELAPLSMPRINHGVLSAEGFLFVLGGQDENKQTLSSGEKYDPDANTWTALPPMNEARHNFGIVEIDGMLYILGGEDGDRELISMECYDIYSKTWTKQPDLTMVRKIGCYAAMKKKIYAMGGGSYGKLFESVECYDPRTQQWTAICPLKERRFGAVACGVAMELYVFGGVRSREDIQGSEMVTCKSEFYHDEFKRWIYLNDQNLCIPASSSFVYGAVPIGASIYVIGDLDTGTNYDYVREFKRSTGTWHHTKPLLPSDLRRTGCAALRIANCKLFRLQLQQGLFRIRVHSP